MSDNPETSATGAAWDVQWDIDMLARAQRVCMALWRMRDGQPVGYDTMDDAHSCFLDIGRLTERLTSLLPPLMNGKGDTRRPASVPRADVERAWERTFGPSVTRYLLACSRDAEDYSVSFLDEPDEAGPRTNCPNCGAPMALVQVSGPGTHARAVSQ